MSILGNWQISLGQTGIRNTDVSAPAFFPQTHFKYWGKFSKGGNSRNSTAALRDSPWGTALSVPEHKGKGNFKSNPLSYSLCRKVPLRAAAAPWRSPWMWHRTGTPSMEAGPPRAQALSGWHRDSREGWLLSQIITFFASIVRDF